MRAALISRYSSNRKISVANLHATFQPRRHPSSTTTSTPSRPSLPISDSRLTMALSPEKIESILRAIIQKTVDDGQEDLLTVRYVRNKGAEWMNLDEGFFSTQDWKDRSKAFIKKTAVSFCT